MDGKQLNPFSGGASQDPKATKKGLKISDIIFLPEHQGRIANWMLRQKKQRTLLPEVVEYLGEDEALVKEALNALVEQGYLQEVQAAGTYYYYLELASKEGFDPGLLESFYQVQTPGSPLAIILSPSGEVIVSPGSTFELCVTVSNQGNESALIDIYIDEVSEIPLQWLFSSRERLALGRAQTSEVFFRFQIPVDTLPGFYNYTLVVDAREHYPEYTPILNSGRLRVVPLVQESRTFNDPTFSLQPPTSSTTPAPLQPGEQLSAIALVYNRSHQVDRFRLTCPDIPQDWFRVIYPEGLPQLGIIVDAQALELNPGDQGQIQLWLKPPPETWAGIYSPTIRLYSTNNPDLVLLDVFYLQVLPVYLLNVDIITLVGKVRDRAGVFELRLQNLGNTVRDVIVRAKSQDERELCTYTLTPERVQIQPGESVVVNLQVQPPQSWWRRPFYGRVFNFIVELEDTQQLPIPNSQFQGVLMWEPRPWWHFLLLILTILGTIGLIIFLIWWFFPRPPAPPEIIEFAPQDTSYKETDGDIVRLNWKINNPKQLQTLNLQGLSPDGLVVSSPVTYDFRRGIPASLRNFCTVQIVLICQNVPTDARRAGDYTFELKIVPKRRRGAVPQSMKTNVVRIEPIPLPKITEFAPTKPVYDEVLPKTTTAQAKTTELRSAAGNTASTTSSGEANSQNSSGSEAAKPATPSEGILLNWKIANASQIKELRVIGRAADGSVNSPLKRYDFSKNIPEQLSKLCEKKGEELTCTNVPTDAKKAGTYVFELTAIPQQESTQPLESKKTDPIKINPKLIPAKIVEFKLNGKDALPKYIVELDPEKPIILALAWKVEGAKDVQILPAPGTVPPEGRIPYPLSKEPGTATLTLQVTDEAGEQISRSVTIETVVPPAPPEIPLLPSQAMPPLPPGLSGGGAAGVPVLPPPPPPSADGSPGAPGATSPTAPGTASPGAPTPAPTLPPPPGSSPPIPSDRNAPPPAELPPKFN